MEANDRSPWMINEALVGRLFKGAAKFWKVIAVLNLLLDVEEGMPVICNFQSCSGDILKVSYDPWRKPWPIYEVLR